MRRCLRIAALLAVASTPGGCAALATPTPTPAASLTREQVNDPAPPPDEHYYGIVYGSQRFYYGNPLHTHTWATVVKVAGKPGCGVRSVQADTISWMPQDLKIDFFPFVVKPAVNLGLHETIAWATKDGQKVAIWGPYEIQPALYRRFLVQKEFLESGQVGYQLVDNVGEAAKDGSGCDCIHGISDMDPQFDRARYPLIFYGYPASRRIVHEAARRGAFIDPDVTHDWVIPLVGLDRYQLERKAQPYVGVRPPLSPDQPVSRVFGRR